MSDEWIGDVYHGGFWVAWVIAFFIVWIGCTFEYGFLGFALAWMPAAIVATVAAYLWPFILLISFLIVIKLWH